MTKGIPSHALKENSVLVRMRNAGGILKRIDALLVTVLHG
jgi:hypothetical protein